MWFKKKTQSKELPPLRMIKQEITSPKPETNLEELIKKGAETLEKVKKNEEKETTVQEPPLFIKLEKYRDLINSIMQLKALVQMIKNSTMALEHLLKTQIETLNVIKRTTERVEKKISKINSEIVKPPMMPFMPVPEYSEENYQEIQSIDATVANLKAQIEQLKEELSTISQ